MTIFEKILAGEVATTIIYEDQHAIAFNDISPQAPVHVLVIPKKAAQNFTELALWSADAVSGYIHAINHVIAMLNLEKGYRLIFNTDSDGGQTVEYLHAHILAGAPLGWPPFPT